MDEGGENEGHIHSLIVFSTVDFYALTSVLLAASCQE